MENYYPLDCRQCDREFFSQGALQQHYRDSPVHRLISCEICDMRCIGVASLDRHMAEYHPPPSCSLCDRTFVSEKALLQHISQSPAHKVYVCKECCALCVGAAGLDKHMELCHPPPYCAECDRTFVSDAALQQHERESATHKVLVCEMCGADCVGTAALELHMDIYHPPPHCVECDRTFVSDTALQQHQRESAIHKVLTCELCDVDCVGTAALDQHMETYHPPPHCALCDRDVPSEQALQQHLQTSSAHLPTHACRECDRWFNTEAALRQHLNSPVHVHRCGDCDRTFASAAALQQHLLSSRHVYRCNTCDQTFPSRAALDDHSRREAVDLSSTPGPTSDARPAIVPGTAVLDTPALGQQLGEAEAPSATALNRGANGSERNANNSQPPPLPGAAQESGPSLVAGSSDTWEDVPLFLLRLESREQEANMQGSTVPPGNESPAEPERISISDHPLSHILPTLLPRVGGVPRGSSTGAEGASSSGPVPLSSDAVAAPLGLSMGNRIASQAQAGGMDDRKTDLKGKTKGAPVAQGSEGSAQFEGSSCCICFEKPKDAAFVPCGHRVCYGCGVVVHKQRGTCPMCNKKIDSVLRLFG